MSHPPQLFIYEEKNFMPGQDTFVDSVVGGNAVVFEDNGETGYFYAVNPANNEILDALHIYNGADVKDKDKQSVLKILWTKDQNMCFLSINNYYHAVFDFKNNAGYCRNAFPESRSKWAKTEERELTDELIKKLSQESL